MPKPQKRSPVAKVAPRAPRQSTALTSQELDLSDAAVDLFTRAVGGRQKLMATLAVADTDGHVDKVINCLLDPAYQAWPLRKICIYAGITVADLFASYKRALFVQAHIDAAHRIITQLPPVVDDVMRRAAPQPIPCRCQAAPPPPPDSPPAKPCLDCRGTGTVMTEPNVERQKLALQLAHLIEPRAGVIVQQNAIAAGSTALASTAPGSLEQLQQVVGDLLFTPGRVRAAAPGGSATTIDVTPTPQTPAPHEATP
jgi:hypothetical protein